MTVLNSEIYRMEHDTLIADLTHPQDVRMVSVSLTKGAPGTIVRGQVLDLAEGSYICHAEQGTANCIVAENTDYTEADEKVNCPVYVSGTFMESGLVSAVDLTDADVENLRGVGIYVK